MYIRTYQAVLGGCIDCISELVVTLSMLMSISRPLFPVGGFHLVLFKIYTMLPRHNCFCEIDTCARAHTHTHTHAHIRMHMYTHTHTRMHKRHRVYVAYTMHSIGVYLQ